MSRSGRPTDDKPLPPLYAMTHGGIEAVAADEITRDLGGEVKKTARGLVVFRVDELTDAVLKLRTTEDVFLLAWGSDSLTYTADDLETIRNWTASKPDWQHLFKLHHKIRPKTKGRPTYHVVCQMQGEHGYRRADARAAFIAGLAGQDPARLAVQQRERVARNLADDLQQDRGVRRAAHRPHDAAPDVQARPHRGVAAADGRGRDGPARGHRPGDDRARPDVRGRDDSRRGDRRGPQRGKAAGSA